MAGATCLSRLTLGTFVHPDEGRQCEQTVRRLALLGLWLSPRREFNTTVAIGVWKNSADFATT